MIGRWCRRIDKAFFRFEGAMLDTVIKDLSTSQRRELEKFGSRVSEFGINFAVCDINGKLVLLYEGSRFKSDEKHLIRLSREALNQDDNTICRFGEHNRIPAAVLKSNGGVVGVALIDLGDKEGDSGYFSEMLELL